eukprot:sb/3465791/
MAQLSSIDCRWAFIEKWFEIEQNGLHHCFSHAILDRNMMPDIGIWLFSIPTRLFPLRQSCCCCTGLPMFFKRCWRKIAGGTSLNVTMSSRTMVILNEVIPAWRADGFKSKFENDEIKLLYSQYFFKQKLDMVVKFIIVLGLNALLFFIFYFAHSKKFLELLILVIVVFFICIVMFIELINTRSYSTKHLTLMSIAIWTVQCIMLYALIFFIPADQRTPSDHVALVVFITFVTYTMLPLSLIYTVALGLLLALSHALVTGLCAKQDTEHFSRQLIANILVYICSNLCGLYHHHLSEIAHRRTFLETRGYVKNQLELSQQKDQQVSEGCSLVSSGTDRNKKRTNQNSLFMSGHVTGYQPIRPQGPVFPGLVGS